ncbi:putative acetyltransferase At3g50280 [Silene latifolia]|uniref:putative acetyltransferase At3g50280 n=1 Tax=Silene latifolia TaxID=37657 RepID=UPI003D77C916
MAYYDEQNTQTKVISESYVKPKRKNDAAQKPYFLGPVDLWFLPLNYMQKGLVFGTKPKNIHSFINKLKESVSISLVDFYPLAGQLVFERIPDEDASLVYVDCNKGPGARIIHVVAEDIMVKDVLCSSDDVHKIVQAFFDLGVEAVNYDGCNRPLLSIQVTEFLDGVFVAFTVSHSLGDGTSLWHFISSLSEIHAQLMDKQRDRDDNNIVISRKPIFEPYFPEGCGPDLKLPFTILNKPVTPSNNQAVLRERMFRISSKSISYLKAKANEECGIQNISSFQALSAFMWKSITKARNLRAEDETCIVFAMNSRPRFSPPISNDYFGNYIVRQNSLCKASELLSQNFGLTAMQVHQLVVGQFDKAVSESVEIIMKFLSKNPQNDALMASQLRPSLVVIGGSLRLDMYGSEFGLGKAEAVFTGYCDKIDGKIIVNPGRNGDGSVDLDVYLKPETMNTLELDEQFMSLISVY